MTQFILHITSYAGLVPGAKHYRGRVEGEHPESCHGSTHYNDPEHRGKTTCDEGHEIPDQVKWDVEAAWSQERHVRWAAAGFEGDGPQAFYSAQDVIDRAIIQFLDGSEDPCEPVEPALEGDELWYGYVGFEGDGCQGDDGWGTMIASCHRG